MAEEELEQPVEAPGEAAAEETPEPTRAEMTAYLVRNRSEKEGKLTPVNILAYEGTLLTPEERDQLLAEIQADESCSDIKVMRTSKGDAFLYSTAAMSDTYARILLRAAEDNPYAVIAGTVRE